MLYEENGKKNTYKWMRKFFLLNINLSMGQIEQTVFKQMAYVRL